MSTKFKWTPIYGFKDSYTQYITAKKAPSNVPAEFKRQLIQQCLQPDTSTPPVLKSPSYPQTDFLPVILHSNPVRQEVPLPPALEKKALAHIRIPLHHEQDSVQDQMMEIDWPVESLTELLVLIQDLTQ